MRAKYITIYPYYDSNCFWKRNPPAGIYFSKRPFSIPSLETTNYLGKVTARPILPIFAALLYERFTHIYNIFKPNVDNCTIHEAYGLNHEKRQAKVHASRYIMVIPRLLYGRMPGRSHHFWMLLLQSASLEVCTETGRIPKYPIRRGFEVFSSLLVKYAQLFPS